MMRMVPIAGAALSMVLVAASAIHAGEITGFSWSSGVASVALTSIDPPVDPNNDDVAGASPNEIFITQKDYIGIGPVDIVFDVEDRGGVTEYRIREGVNNGTGVDWSGYHIELGFGIGTSFVKSGAGDGLDFDAPDFNSPFFFNPSPGFFPDVDVFVDDVIASGGVMPDGSFAGDFVFHVDVPDGIAEFTVRQSPIPVPEPSTALLVAMGLLVTGGVRRA